MSTGVARERPQLDRGRSVLLGLGVLAIAVGLAPPLGSLARRYVFAEALQFALFGLVAPALVVLGAPWGLLAGVKRRADALADVRKRHPEFLRSLVVLVGDVTALVVWRLPVVVNAVGRYGSLAWLEMVTLVLPGIVLWLELLDSPPLHPRGSRPNRIAIAAFTMWSTWVLAYLVGLSHASWYRAFHHVAGHGLSLDADQQVMTGVLWLVAASCFIPVIFANLVIWLRSEEDPDEELHRLLREERRRDRVMGELDDRTGRRG